MIYDVKPFKIGTISIQRIFVDKIFASEFYFKRKMFIDLCKHMYDTEIMCKLGEIEQLLNDKEQLTYLVKLKRLEETERIGGISNELFIRNFEYLNNKQFYFSEDFNNSLKYIHDTYVFDVKDIIERKDILNIIEIIKKVFYGL